MTIRAAALAIMAALILANIISQWGDWLEMVRPTALAVVSFAVGRKLAEWS